MGNRGPQSFNKRLKEQKRKDKQSEKAAKRLDRKTQGPAPEEELVVLTRPLPQED